MRIFILTNIYTPNDGTSKYTAYITTTYTNQTRRNATLFDVGLFNFASNQKIRQLDIVDIAD